MFWTLIDMYNLEGMIQTPSVLWPKMNFRFLKNTTNLCFTVTVFDDVSIFQLEMVTFARSHFFFHFLGSPALPTK